MNIYLSSAVTINRNNYPKLKRIRNKLTRMGHKTFGGSLSDSIAIGEGLDPKALYQREVDLINKVDLMIAEVSVPSWGTAFLMEHALNSGKPVLALFYQPKYKNGWPVMIKGHPGLYTQAYDEKSLDLVINNHLDFFGKRKQRRGFFVAIEGVDGSGKTTQVRMLVDAIKRKGLLPRLIDFPRYYSSFHGEVITRLLRGEFGSMGHLDPYLVSLVYALDRLTAKKEIEDWLDSGMVVVANRYTGSNMAHQASKLVGKNKLKFIRWVDEMEYQINAIPREDITVFLDVPVNASQKLIDKKDRRAYLKWRSKKDIAEKDLSHQRKSYRMYQKLVSYYPHWHRINCVDTKKKILSPEKINKKIMNVVEREMGK